MRIKSITLNRFRSHSHTSITGLGKYVVFLGANGSGKSSILDAISFALTGQCRGVDDRGSGMEHLVTRTAEDDGKPKSFGVSLTTAKGNIVRGLGEGPKAKVQGEIGRKFGIDSNIARILVQTGSFTKQSVQVQKNIILALAGNEVSASDIAALLGPAAEVFGLEAISSIEGADRAERELRAARPEIKRQLAALVVPEESKGAADAEEKVQQALQDLQALRDERDQAIRAASEAIANRDAAVREGISLNAELANMGKPTKAAAFDVAEAEKDIQRLDAAESERQEKYQTLKSEVDSMLGQRDELRRQYSAFSKLKGACPACHRAITKSDSESVTKDLQNRAKKINETLAPKEKALEILAYDQTAAGKLLSLRGQVQQAREAAARAEQTDKRRKAVMTRLAELATILKKPAPAQADTSELDKDIQAGEGFVAQQRELGAKAGERQRALDMQNKLQARLDACESLVEALGPKGPVRAKFTEGGGADFQNEVNEVASGLGLPQVEVDLSAGFAVRVGGSPAALLSASEDYRLNIAFSVAVAKRSGTGFIVLDGAEILDGDSKALLDSVLEKAGLEQCFIAATPETMPESVPPSGDWSIFAVTKDEAGVSSVAPLGAVAAAV